MISSKTLAAALFVLVVALSFGTAHAGFSYTTLDVPGAVSTSAKDISGSNIVGGYSTGSNSYGYLYNGSTYTPLNFSAMGIDGSNIVGCVGNASGQCQGITYDSISASSTIFNVPGASATVANDISGSNVVGRYVTSPSSPQYGFVYDGSNFTTITVPGAVWTSANSISGSNIVGIYQDASGYLRSFLYNGSTYTTINVPGAVATSANGISGSNISGWYNTASGSGSFLYNGSSYTTFNVPGAVSTQAWGIDGNNIVGTYLGTSHDWHGFLATWVPEPAALDKKVIDIDPPGFNPAYWMGNDANNTDQLKNANPRTEEAWLEALLGKSYDDLSVNYIDRILKGTSGLGLDDKSLTAFDPGFAWDYAVVKYDGMWIAYEDTGNDNLLTTDTFDWGISHLTFFGPTSVPEPATLLLLGFGLVGLAGMKRKFKK